MLKRFAAVAVTGAVLMSQAGCYHTSIVTDRAPGGREYSDRQWFTIAGLVPLSSPAGGECPNGLARAESELSGTDWLINIGLGVAGAFAGAAICKDESDERVSSCAATGATLIPFLLGSRTVKYTCVPEARGQQDFMPQPPVPQG